MRARSFKLLVSASLATLWSLLAVVAAFAGDGVGPLPK
jgi:hypothetical protein